MATVVAEKIIRIDVIASANAQRSIAAIAADMKKVEGAATNMQKSVSTGFAGLNSTFSRVAQFFGGGALAVSFGTLTKAILDSASSYQVLEARLGLVLGSSEKATRATAQIMDIAKLTGREIDGVSKLYEKAARSAQQFGISEDKVREITLGFSQAIKLSGASTQEAYASLVQFGQALASGRLQGDEFRSLMENNSVFMYEFAKAAGVTVSELRKMGTEGKLNAKFLFDTMAKEGADGLNMMQRLNKMAAAIPLTFSQSLNSMQTSLSEFVGVTAKLLDAKSTDPLGIFGPMIRGVSNLTNAIKELTVESNALDQGVFTRILKLLSVVPTSPLDFARLLLGGSPNKPTLAATIDKEASDAYKAVLDAQKRLSSAEELELRNSKDGPNLKTAAMSAQTMRLTAEVEKAEAAYAELRKTQKDVSYGERYTEPTGKPPPVVDPEAARKLKSATEALKDFVEQKEREAESSRRLLAGEAETKKSAVDLVALEGKLKEAHAGTNSEMAKRGQLAIKVTEDNKLMLEQRTEVEKMQAKSREEDAKVTDSLNKQIERDQSSIDALHNKTRATDEYTEAALNRGRAEKILELTALENGSFSATSPQVQGLYEMIKLYDMAIAKKTEFMDARANKQQQDEQNRIDDKNTKRVEGLTEEINSTLKRGLLSGEGGKSVSEQFIDNLKNALRNKAIDIVINPVTTIISRVLAQLADDFSKRLTRSLYEMISNSSSDPLGSLIGLLTGGSGGTGGGYNPGAEALIPGAATGMSFVPSDNYLARLHRGEAVLTKQENRDYSAGKGRAVNVTYAPVMNIDSRTDAAQVAQIAAEVAAEGNRQLVATLKAQGVL